MVLHRDAARSRFERIFLEEEHSFRDGALLDGKNGVKHVRWQIMTAPVRAVQVRFPEGKMVPDCSMTFIRPDGTAASFDGGHVRGYDRQRPILGGYAIDGSTYFGETNSWGRRIREERYRDGRYRVLLEVTTPREPELPSAYVALWLLRALNWISLIRKSAGEPMLDFALQFLTDNRRGFELLTLGAADRFYRSGRASERIEAAMTASPLYEIGVGDNMERTANEIFGDIANSFGAEAYNWNIPPSSYEL